MADILGLELVSQHLRAKERLRKELRLVKKQRDEWRAATHATQLELDKANAKLERMEPYAEQDEAYLASLVGLDLE